jgi:PTS system ascorbate-specific IIA component
VINDTPPEALLARCQRLADEVDRGEGLLVLTDLYGSTPANVALALARGRAHTRVIAGVNLPMLLRALNYAALDLDTLVDKALDGGRDGVRLCET